MPEPKKIKKLTHIKYDWKIGDTFAYKIEKYLYNEKLKELNGRFLIVTKIEEYKQK